MAEQNISPEALPHRHLKVHTKQMAVVDLPDSQAGRDERPTFLFLHGNPTSSYLWRNVMRPLNVHGRCVAPDLIGMGHSDKLDASGPNSYTLAAHGRFLDDLLDQLDLGSRVVPVLHDWGSALGFDWARQFEKRLAGIVYMEAIVRPMSLSEWPEGTAKVFAAMRSEAGEKMVLEKNTFVERILPASIMRDLSEDEMAVYRAPFATPGEDRRPTLSWPRQIPFDGEPKEVCDLVERYGKWLQQSPLPKLFINADPGAILLGESREFARSFPNQSEVTVPGIHFIQEDSPQEIAAAIEDWLPQISVS